MKSVGLKVLENEGYVTAALVVAAAPPPRLPVARFNELLEDPAGV
jgi:hypothetical protein